MNESISKSFPNILLLLLLLLLALFIIMAAAIVRKSFTSLLSENHIAFMCKTHVSIFFSTSTESQLTGDISSFLIHKYQFSPQTGSKLASVIPNLKNPENAESILSFLKQNGFSNSQLDRILRHVTRQRLSLSLDGTIKPKIKFLRDLGFSATDVAEIVSNDPIILHSSLNSRIVPTISVLKDLLGSDDQVVRLLKKPRFGWHLFVDIDKTLLPNIEFLKSSGINMDQIRRRMFSFPNFFTIQPENMRRSFERADELGADRTSKLFIYAVRAVSCMCDETLEHKLKTFRDLGFSEDDIQRVLRFAPLVFCVSGDKIKRVKEILLETGKYDISCIINYPKSLMYSFKNRYKPRLQVLRDLEKRNIIEKWPTLARLCILSDKEFFKRYTDPNTKEFSKAFIEKNVVSRKREMELVQKDVHDSSSRST